MLLVLPIPYIDLYTVQIANPSYAVLELLYGVGIVLSALSRLLSLLKKQQSTSNVRSLAACQIVGPFGVSFAPPDKEGHLKRA